MSHDIVVVTHTLWPEARQAALDIGRLIEWPEQSPIPRATLMHDVADATALIVTSDDQIDREVIEKGERLRVISTISSGVDHIDVQAAHARGIIVCHTPGAADEAVADMTIALMLACARNIIAADAFVKKGDWRYPAIDLMLGSDVQGSTIGIVGLGRIGVLVAHRAIGFGMRILYYSQHRNLDAEQRLGVQYGGIDNLLREADFVTLHVPLTPSTQGMINESRLRLMKPSAYLINIARGAIVDHAALVRALRERWIAGAGLDVFTQEPISPHDPLLQLPNVILTPHIGASTIGGVGAMMRMAVEQVRAALAGRQPDHPVTPRDLAA